MSATSAVVPIDDTALTAILPFIAFVQRHLASIAPSIVVILFNHLTADQANHLASALLSNNSIKLQLFRCDIDDEQPTIYPATLVHESALWIVLEPYDSANSRFAFKAPLRTIDLVLPCPVGGDPLFLGYFTGKITLLTVDTHVIERNLALRVWHVTKCCLQLSSGLVSERTLVKSLFWQKFMQQVNVLPNGELITAVGDAPTNVLGVAMVQLLRHRQSVYMFGYRVGLLKLLAERLNGGFLNYKSVMSLKERAQVVYPEPLNVSTIDERLALSFQINDTQMSTYKLALKPHLRYKMFKTVNYASHTRFVVLVPRVVVRSQSNTWSEIYPKIIIIVCIVLSAILFAVLRFGFRCLMNGFDGASTVSSVMDSIFDTLPRSMANTTGSSQIGRSTAERQLLIVIGFFGFLAGCMMSGNLYEGLLNVSEIQFRYRNLSDVCRDRLDLLMHPDLAPTQQSQSINQSLRTTSSNSLLFVDDCLQTVKILRDPQILPNSALVLSEEQLVQLNHSQHMFMQLPQVYVTIPEYVFTNQHFMVPVVQRTMQHIVDHGLLAELQSIAQHANAIRIATNNHHQHHHHSHKSEDPRSLADSMFEFYVLGFGLGLAVIVFFGEQIIGRKQRTVFFGMGNGPQNQQIYGFGKRKKLVGRIGRAKVAIESFDK